MYEDITYLRQIDLARRWKMSARTLESWRCKKIGPPYLKQGGIIRYPLHEVQKYEQEHCVRTNA